MNAYFFGRFRLDLDKQVLFSEGEPLSLRPKSFDVLKYLVRNAGRLVGRDEIFDAIWPDLVVTDDSLTQCLIEIRKVLGDEDRSVIRTIPRRGYIFALAVTTEPPRPDSSDPHAPFITKQARLPSRWTLVALALFAVAMAITWWRIDLQDRESATPPAKWQPQPASIAVLPFADMSEDGDKQYLADGIAEEILNLLAQSPDLTVIARTSSFSFKDRKVDIGKIARQLNVAHVLEGSVRQAGERVRVTAQLINGATGIHVWSETFDDRLTDVFDLQDSVARAVAEVLKVELIQEESIDVAPRDHNPDPQAWETYLRGRLYYSRRSEGDIMRAQRRFEEAVAIDPQFADAWVSLSATYLQRADNVTIPVEDRLAREVALPLIQSSLERALAINPNHPEALWRFAGLISRTDPVRAIELIGRAVELGRNHAMVQGMMGGFMVGTGYPDLALPLLRRTAMLDPLSAAHQSELGHTLFFTGHLSEAERVLTHAVELNPTGSDEQRAQLAWINIAKNDLVTAAEFTDALADSLNRDMTLVMLNHLRGRNDLVDESMARLLKYPGEDSAGALAQVLAVQGKTDEAFEWLNTSINLVKNSPPDYRSRRNIVILEYSPFLVSLHDDARWEAWISNVSQWRSNEVNKQVRALIEEYIERHPEHYETTVM